MAYVSAVYGPPSPLPMPEGSPRTVLATDDQGVVHSMFENSLVGDWIDYLANGGTIDTYVAPPTEGWQVNAERDRRVVAGFMFDGKLYQSDEFSQRNIADAANAADVAVSNGAQPGNLRWQPDSTTDFVWLTARNVRVPMDAYTMQRLGQAMLRHKQQCIMNARALKDTIPIPMDYKDNTYWPPVQLTKAPAT